MHFYYLAVLAVMIVKPLVMMVLRVLGIGMVSYLGINFVIGQAKDYMLANMGNVAQSIQMVLGLAKIDVALNMYFAAITTRMVLTGIDKLADRRTKLGNVTTFTA
ncbi:DUF2523 domain-containing protein [Pseudomonas sp. NPDC047963]|jgi:hypothetical protein|uniref:DUF2523 domain-containing protein n=1 Tax=Pseudomonadaceae TaxID=135621 RepID=UPI000617E602|nr:MULTISPECIES: DUF2523 domain-containing protein [Pseudomonadaceae]MAL34723.1 DUF2523 domain-containing protein [Pseudomonas sp.]MBU0949464.1 DUF2523 domain-containing protein [Gammaproteobacteria bacterium]KJJ63627.1 hypothetical protein RT21_09945 [Pseudomonas sp. 10B238]MBK3794550.1 DUF2523 domain-containing protein [Stutzerimonas stutzeri]MBK3879097.1 DUF2523 domain-containing protein [Stutzerimonas stutzeri]|tara:strand:- start:2442 stop:2756 length:315 start_codon:yes stop_codon:yes gene_type:complete